MPDLTYPYPFSKLLIERIPSTDQLIMESKYGAASGLTGVDCWVGLADNTATAVTSYTLPPTGPGMTDIGRWNQRDFYISALGPGYQGYDYFFGTITNINTALVVPEPGSVALIVCGGLFSAGLAFRRRRRR